MNAYNGYSGDQRNRAQRWLNMMIASGKLVRPTVCMACGQNQGVIDMHAEDYSEPFALGKTDEFHLCFACHLAVHCRFRNPAAWDRYRTFVRAGGRTEAFPTRNFPKFIVFFNGGMWELTEINMRPEPRPLDVIDGWLLAHTGKGWR